MSGTGSRNYWVAVLSEAEGLRWVLKNSRMAWTEGSSSRAIRIQPGDGLLLYVARGAFHNPTRDESQLIGVAEVIGPVSKFKTPMMLAGRRFVVGCQLRMEISAARAPRCALTSSSGWTKRCSSQGGVGPVLPLGACTGAPQRLQIDGSGRAEPRTSDLPDSQGRWLQLTLSAPGRRSAFGRVLRHARRVGALPGSA